jgi:hypothetical protein
MCFRRACLMLEGVEGVSPLRVSMIVKTEYSEEQRWQDLQSLNRRFPSGTP